MMTEPHSLVDGLRAFLTGLGQKGPDMLDFIIDVEDWAALALKERERRATAILHGLSDEEVTAIARSELNLNALAQHVRAATLTGGHHG